VYTDHAVTTSVKIGKSGSLHALAFCNIHGLWESTKDIKAV
jgi:superoxide reductase